MQTEFEAKFYPLQMSKDEFRELLTSKGATLVTPERKLQAYLFDHIKNPEMSCDYVRVRNDGGKVTFSAKVHADSTDAMEDQKEEMVEASDFETLRYILEIAGLKEPSYQEKLRETWELEGTLIEIDTWPMLEPYPEIEGESEEAVKKCALTLGLDWEKREVTSILPIYMREMGWTFEESLEKLKEMRVD